MTGAPKVSVIVNTLDRAAYLAHALAGLERLRYGPFEVIVVNGPSSDGTSALLAGYSGRIKVASCPERNLSMSRNIGLSASAGDIIAFIDDDAIPHPEWLTRLVEPFADPDIGVAGGFTIGRRGIVFQERKNLADRLGEPHHVSDYFDEKAICQPGSWLFPSPMGTNVAFRRSGLEAIGGFDETFAYFLDETDVCLRMMDAGFITRYVPDAFVWHQFGGSGLRNDAAVPSSLIALSRSKAYFIHRHAGASGRLDAMRRVADGLSSFSAWWNGAIDDHARAGAIEPHHRDRLRREVAEGIAAGAVLARERHGQTGGHWAAGGKAPAFLDAGTGSAGGPTYAFVCRRYPPRDEGGIARWTALLSGELAARGRTVHVITEASDGPSLRFENGIWLHEIEPRMDRAGPVSETFGLPEGPAAWAAAVAHHLPVLRSFGVDTMSFPIWDLEGLACLGTPGLRVVMSLHTTFGVALEHNPEWGMRPSFRARIVEPMIAAERRALSQVPLIIANTRAAIADIGAAAGIDFAEHAVVVPHGTVLPAEVRPISSQGPLRVLFVGRAEHRKGVDIAIRAIALAVEQGVDLVATLAGAPFDVGPDGIDLDALEQSGRLRRPGIVSREALERAYAEADLVLMPSRYESFGLVAIEAMAHGRPVLGGASGGLREVIVEGETGHLVPTDDEAPEVFAAHLKRLAADRKELARLGEGARRAVEARFTTTIMAEAFEAAISGQEASR